MQNRFSLKFVVFKNIIITNTLVPKYQFGEKNYIFLKAA